MASNPSPDPPEIEGLRQRKKRLLRDQLSDTATALFIEHGFNGVRVSDVAEACGVSEATVFNYFPTKEALVLDRFEDALASLRAGLEDQEVDPLRSVQQVLEVELASLTHWLGSQDDESAARATLLRFGDLIDETPSLLAYQGLMFEKCVASAAMALARQMQMDWNDPEPQIAARSIMCLWFVQAQSMRRHLRHGEAVDMIRAVVGKDVQRAAELLRSGLAASD